MFLRMGGAVFGLTISLLLATPAFSWDSKAGDQRIKGPELTSLLIGKTVKLVFTDSYFGILQYKAGGKYSFVAKDHGKVKFTIAGRYEIKADGTVCTTQDGRPGAAPNCSEMWVRNGGKLVKIFGDLERDTAIIQ